MESGVTRNRGEIIRVWVFFIVGILYSLALLYILTGYGYSNSFWFILLGMLMVSLAYRAHSASLDFMFMWLMFACFAGKSPLWTLYLAYVSRPADFS